MGGEGPFSARIVVSKVAQTSKLYGICQIETETETAISLKIETEIFSRFLFTSGIVYPLWHLSDDPYLTVQNLFQGM